MNHNGEFKFEICVPQSRGEKFAAKVKPEPRRRGTNSKVSESINTTEPQEDRN